MSVRAAALPRPRARAVVRRRRLRPGRLKLLLAVLAAAVVIGGGWLWLRDSSLVSVNRVTVSGARGPESYRIRQTLTAAAAGMTTLHVDAGTLRAAVQPFPTVAGISIDSHPPHNLTIVVHMRTAVAVLADGGRDIPVSAQGRLLPGAPHAGLPTISGRAQRAEVAVAAAAPDALRAHIVNLWTGPRGVTARLRNGPALYFGTADELAAKWAAVAAVLAAPSAAGASYLDVTVPDRPAAGGLEPTTVPTPATQP